MLVDHENSHEPSVHQKRPRTTYNFTRFFGPGLPLGLSSPSAAAELRLTPVFASFLTPSIGGGIAAELSVPLGAGVFGVDSEPLSPGEDVAAGRVFEVVDDGAFDSISSLTTGTGAKRARLFGESLSVTIRLFGDFLGFGLMPVAGEALVVGPISMLMQ